MLKKSATIIVFDVNKNNYNNPIIHRTLKDFADYVPKSRDITKRALTYGTVQLPNNIKDLSSWE